MLYSKLGQRARPPVITDLMSRALSDPEMISLAAGFTDNAAMPGAYIAQAVRDFEQSANDNEHMQYGANRGRMDLRTLTARRVARLDGAEPYNPEDVFISNGSQQALYLAMQSLCEPGDIILVEAPTYFVFLEMLEGLGIEVLALPGDGHGRLFTDQLRAFLSNVPLERVRGVYLNSYFANPTSSSLSLSEKTALASAFAALDFFPPIIEDAAYRELHFGTPAECPSILAMEAFGPFPKLYTGTYTKTFATGLKVGFAICPDAHWREKLLAIKGCHDFGTSNFSQAIIEKALLDGEFDRHTQHLHLHYKEKAAQTHAALDASGLMALGWSWHKPMGGLYFWLQGPDKLDTAIDSAFTQACLEEKVLVVPGVLCMPTNAPSSYIRLSYGAIQPDRIQEGVDRLSRAAARCFG